MERSPDTDPRDSLAADEASAGDARRRLREHGIVPIEPDERVAVMLAPGESVVAVRRGVAVERRKDVRDPGTALMGDLYVTTDRLLCLGRVRVDVALADITDAVVAVGTLRLAVGDGRGLVIRTADPYVLRVEIGAVREAARLSSGGALDRLPAGARHGGGAPRG